MTSNNVQQPGVVCKNGDVITLSFSTNHPVTIESQEISGQFFNIETNDNRTYKANYTVQDHFIKDQENITLYVNVKDAAGNDVVGLTHTEFNPITYYAPIEYSELSFNSSNANDGTLYAKNGDVIRFRLKTNHQVNAASTICGEIVNTNVENTKVSAEYTINGQVADQSVVQFTTQLTDNAGNTPILLNEGNQNNRIVYYAPITGESSLTATYVKTPTYIKNGSTISVSTSTNHATNFVNSTILGRTAAQSGNDTSSLVSTLGYKDFTFNQENFNAVRYYAPIEFTNKELTSNNVQQPGVVCKNGDVSTLSFSTNHPVAIESQEISGQSFNIETNDNRTYNANYTVQDHFIKDQENITLYVNVKDAAGNDVVGLTHTEFNPITYYAPIEYSELSFNSSNTNDGTLYAKNGDVIRFSFKTNHQVNAASTICGEIVNTNVENTKVSAEYTIYGQVADQSVVQFTTQLTDNAGNTPIILSEGNQNNRIVYYAPITSESSLTATYVKTPTYIKNGSTISVNTSTNHATNFVNSTILGRTAAQSGNDTSSLVSTLIIPDNESSLPEGNVNYAISLNDKAGNVYDVSHQENIIYDRTQPSIKIEPQITGFTNKDIDFSVTYSDSYLDGNDLFIDLNGSRQFSGTALNGTSYTHKLKVSLEDNIELMTGATDMAGNKAEENSARVVIDKTNPLIKVIDIDIEKTPVYKSGFIIADHFKIEDKYLKGVNATLTNRTGISQTIAWDINNPVTNEGLQTLEMTAEDMASNLSTVLRYSFYIDGTAPKLLIKDKASSSIVNLKDNKATLGRKANLELYLDKIWMGDEKPDRFTKVELVDEKGKVLKNLIENKKDVSSTSLNIEAPGKYMIKYEALDDVGNETKEKTIKLTLNDQQQKVSLLSDQETKLKNTGFILALVVLFIISVGIIAFLYVKNNKKAKK